MIKKIIIKIFKDPLGFVRILLFRLKLYFKWFYAFYIKKDYGVIERTRWYRENGDEKLRAAGFLNVSFNYVEGESLIMALKDIAVSSGSACTSASLEPSYVLRALGLKDELAHSSIRFGIGRFTNEEEIEYTIQLVRDSVEKLRILSPLWDMYKDGVDLD